MALVLNGSGITSANIADGTIVNADINSSAAIAGTKVDGSFGKVLQVVSFSTTTEVSSSSTTYVNSNIVKSITPSSTSSRILILTSFGSEVHGGDADSGLGVAITRDATTLTSTEIGMYVSNGNAWGSEIEQISSISYLDSPATTSAVEYRLAFKAKYGATAIVRKGQTITLMEIGA
jgi:hypothetical protein